MKPIICPNCGDCLKPRKGEVKRAYSYDDCLRRCEKCSIGFSNAKSKPTLIYKNYLNNLPGPIDLHNKLDDVLFNSLNKRSQINKKKRIGFSTSEDALTWSFFKYFVAKDRLEDLLRLLNIESKSTSISVFLWGVNIAPYCVESSFRNRFNKISTLFGEKPGSKTEPDVVIELEDKLIFIEVKYRSGNDIKKESKDVTIEKVREKFNKYKISNIDFEKLVESGHYELYRNWAFASKLSKDSDFVLINLGPSKLFNDTRKNKLQLFEESIKSDRGEFVKLSWEDMIENMVDGHYDEWFIVYLNEKLNSKNKCSYC